MKEENQIIVLNNRKEKIIKKMLYVIEFICSIIFMSALHELIVQRYYFGQYSNISFILCLFSGLGIISIIYYSFIKYREKLEKIFLVVAIPIGMAYLIFLAPMHAPDENAHVFRAYEISKGIFFTPVNEENLIRSNIPDFFIENHNKEVSDYITLSSKMKEETDYNAESEVVSLAHTYFPTLYLPSALMFFIGRIFSVNGMIAIYMARIANLITFLICGYYIIKIMPFGKMLMFAYMMIPMVLHQFVAVSADGITNLTILLFIAYSLHLYYKKEDITKKDQIVEIIFAILISVHKSVYFPIVLIILMFLGIKKVDKKQKIKFISITILISLIMGIIWMGSFSKAVGDMQTESNTPHHIKQLLYILKNPMKYIQVLYKTINTNFEYYYLTFMGHKMGWLNIIVRRLFLDIYFIILLFSPFVEKNNKELERKHKILFGLISVCTVLLIFTALYMGYTRVNASIIAGIQGRYFFPVVILLLLALCGKEKFIKIKNIETIYSVLIVVINFMAITDVVKFFL